MRIDLPAGVATSIGSLPHRDPVAAAQLMLTVHPQLPAIPTLPRRTPAEGMLGQAVVGVRGVQVGDDGELVVDPRRVDALAQVTTDIDHDAFGGLRAFLRVAEGRRGPVKWQFTGPMTLGLALMAKGVPASTAFDVAVRAVREHLRALHQAVAEALPDCPQVVFVDEPGLGAILRPGFPLAPDSAIDLVSGALAAIEATAMVGVHHCGHGDWAAILATGPAILSLPVRSELLSVAGYLAAFLGAGGWVAWGVIPTDRPVRPSVDRYWQDLAELWCGLVKAGCHPGRLRQQAIVTPACGLGLHTEAQAARVLGFLDEVSERVRARSLATRLSAGA